MIDTPRRPADVAARVFSWTVALLLVTGLGGATWVGVRAGLAADHLRSAQATVAAATAVDDPSAAMASLATIGDDTAAAAALTGDPVWRAATHLPWVGPQLAAVSRSAAALDDVSAHAFAPLAASASDLSPAALTPVDGTIDVARIAAVEPAAALAAAALRRAADDLSGIDRAPLLGDLARTVEQSTALLIRAADSADALHRATEIVPTMFGADGPRSYLVLFQNNAEWRSLGGVVGAVAQVDTAGGRISLVSQASSSDFTDVAEAGPVLPLTDEDRALFDTRPARFVQNSTQIPDFSVGAPLAREMWRRLHGVSVDGVVTLDPVTLSYLLRATGPVALPSGEELTADNAVSLLLDEVYRRYDDPDVQDAFFQSAATAVFQSLAAGRADPTALISAVTRAGEERRLLVWNADAETQAILDGTPLQGALPATDATRSVFGVYLNDGTGSKMDYYLHPEVETAWCGPHRASLHVELRSDAPDPSSLPAYVTGGGEYGVPVGDALTGVYVYLPEGAQLLDRQTGGDTAIPPGFAGGTAHGREVVKWSVTLSPGQRAQLDLEVQLPRTAELGAHATPTRDPSEIPRGGECRFPRG